MKPELFWIPGPWRGRLAIAARPRGGDWLEEETAGWRGAGLDVIVSLLETDEATQLELTGEGDIAKSGGLGFIGFPIPDRGVPQSKAEALSTLASILKALEEGRNVAVHCRQGVGRSGLIAVGVLVGSGVGLERAIEAVSAARGLAVPETAAQLEWLHQLPAAPLVLTR